MPYLERTDFFNNVKKSIAEKSTETWLDLQISFVFYFVTFCIDVDTGDFVSCGPTESRCSCGANLITKLTGIELLPEWRSEAIRIPPSSALSGTFTSCTRSSRRANLPNKRKGNDGIKAVTGLSAAVFFGKDFLTPTGDLKQEPATLVT